MSRRRNRVRESALDELALLGSGTGVAFSGSQYAKMRKELSREYTKNAWKLTGKPYSKKGYDRWMRKYLEKVNRLRTSPKTYQKGQALFTDLKHFNPRYVSKASRGIVPKKRIHELVRMNKKTFKGIVPKRTALFGAGLLTASTLPALAYRYQGKKDWRRSIKETSLQLVGPTLAIAGAYGFYRFRRFGKVNKLL